MKPYNSNPPTISIEEQFPKEDYPIGELFDYPNLYILLI